MTRATTKKGVLHLKCFMQLDKLSNLMKKWDVARPPIDQFEAEDEERLLRKYGSRSWFEAIAKASEEYLSAYKAFRANH